MKQDKKSKLSLNKQTIAKLNNDHLRNIPGGEARACSTIVHCDKSGWTCGKKCTESGLTLSIKFDIDL